MRPAAVVFVERPQYGLQFLEGTLAELGCQSILVADPADLERRQPDRQDVGVYDLVVPTVTHDATALRAAHARISAGFEVRAVVGFSEMSVLPTAILAEWFGVRGIGSDVARRCRNKLQMIEAFTRAGVPCPRYFVAGNGDGLAARVEALGGYPVICKPLMGFASFGVVKAADEPGLRRAINRVRRSSRLLLSPYFGLEEAGAATQVLVQSYVPGAEVAVDGYVEQGRCHVIGVIDKPDVSDGPYFDDRMHIAPTRMEASTARLIERTVADAVRAVGLDDSPFHAEARIHEGRVYILELAARVAFVRLLRVTTGIDMLKVMLALRTGLPPDARPRHRRYGGVLCITPEHAGYFERIENFDQIRSAPGVEVFDVYVEPGRRLAPAPESTGDIGHILAGGDSYEEVLELMNWAKGRLRVVVR